MVLEPLTVDEEDRHRRGIEKIRRRLFSRYTAAAYFVLPNSEVVFAASAESCWNAAIGDYRVFRFGGLAYDVDCCDPAGPATFRVSHFEGNAFLFTLVAAKGHTVSSLRVLFDRLDEVPHSYVLSYRRANLGSVDPGRSKK